MPQNLDTLAVFHQLLYKFKARSGARRIRRRLARLLDKGQVNRPNTRSHHELFRRSKQSDLPPCGGYTNQLILDCKYALVGRIYLLVESPLLAAKSDSSTRKTASACPLIPEANCSIWENGASGCRQRERMPISLSASMTKAILEETAESNSRVVLRTVSYVGRTGEACCVSSFTLQERSDSILTRELMPSSI